MASALRCESHFVAAGSFAGVAVVVVLEGSVDRLMENSLLANVMDPCFLATVTVHDRVETRNLRQSVEDRRVGNV